MVDWNEPDVCTAPSGRADRTLFLDPSFVRNVPTDVRLKYPYEGGRDEGGDPREKRTWRAAANVFRT